MTEEISTAAIRERWAAWNPAPMAPGGTILALCDAVDAARTDLRLERHDARADLNVADQRIERAEARAEAAEARIVELERRIHPSQGEGYANEMERQRVVIEQLQHVAQKQKARIAAVRAVLAAHGPDGMNSAGYDLWSDVNHALLP